MSLSVRIVDNDTGEAYVDIPNATCVMGAVSFVGEKDDQRSTFHVKTKQFAYVRCNLATIYHILTSLQQVIVNTQRKYPGIEKVGEILEFLKKRGKDGN